MPATVFWSGVFLLSLTTLILASRRFTVSAERMGLALGMSPFATGVVIVAIGTSLPELIASLLATLQGSSEIVAGNVLGSSLSNLLLVLAGITLASRSTVRLGDQYILIDQNFLLGSSALLAFCLYDGAFTPLEGLFGLAAFTLYNFYLFREGNTGQNLIMSDTLRQDHLAGKLRLLLNRDTLILIGTAALIFVGAKYTIEALEVLATGFGISKAIISATVLSIGTTLPEAVVSIQASRQGKADIAVGNILGSCIFNALCIPAVVSLVSFSSLTVSPETLALPLPFFLVATLLFYLLTLDKRISRYEGLLFLLIYLLFVGKVSGLV